jgi:hypothetical protein
VHPAHDDELIVRIHAPSPSPQAAFVANWIQLITMLIALALTAGFAIAGGIGATKVTNTIPAIPSATASPSPSPSTSPGPLTAWVMSDLGASCTTACGSRPCNAAVTATANSAAKIIAVGA